MLECFAAQSDQRAIPLIPVCRATFDAWLARQSAKRRNWLTSSDFKIAGEAPCLIPGSDGLLDVIVIGVDSAQDLWSFGALPARLPPGVYRLEADWPAEQQAQAALGWGLGAYRFQRYKQVDQPLPRLMLSEDAASAVAQNEVEAIYLVRDLINTPAADMMPEHLADAAARMTEVFGAKLQEILGDDLLTQDYPAIHAVGRASAHPPRLIDITWGHPEHPKLTLVGKGVCFDSGGLNLKSSGGMRLMKKDMGGAAHVLGLSQLIMASKLPVRLRVPWSLCWPLSLPGRWRWRALRRWRRPAASLVSSSSAARPPASGTAASSDSSVRRVPCEERVLTRWSKRLKSMCIPPEPNT